MFYINYGDKEILGDDTRAIRLIEWSLKQKKIGTEYVKDYACGLTIKLVSDEKEPKIYLWWNQGKFDSYCKKIGNPDQVLYSYYGIEIARSKGITFVTLLDGSKEGVDLLTGAHKGLLGMIRLGIEGPYFHTMQECQTESEITVEANKLVILGAKNKKTIKVGNIAEELIETLKTRQIKGTR
jgi:hypothetical protein